MKKSAEICGIYKIANEKTQQCYIGSSVKVHQRLKDHLNFLIKGTHINTSLQKAWLEHGAPAFSLSIIEVVHDPALLPERELYWINQSGCLQTGYNTKSDQYKRRTLIKIKPETKLKLEQLGMGSMNATLTQLFEFYRKFHGHIS